MDTMTNNAVQKKQMLIPAAGVIILVLIDQITKHMAQNALRGKESFPIINGVFELHYLENKGSAFGLMQGQRIFFIATAALMLFLIPYLYSKIPSGRRYYFLRIVAVMYLAGAVGNAVDRILYGYVIDFFYFSLIDFPIFNVADIYVTTATICLVVLILFYYKDEDFEQIHIFTK